jgi:hypothetical protein
MTLKKITFLLTLLISLFGTIQQAHAQSAIIALIFGDKVASEKFNLSMELGVNFSQFSNLSNTEQYKSGLNFGIAGNIMLNENWFLSPTAYFISKRKLQLESFSLNSGNPDFDKDFVNKKADISLKYIDVPILLAYQTTNKKFRFGIAPQISFLTDSEIEIYGDSENLKRDYKYETNSIDYGVMFNIGYSLGEARKGKGIYLQLRYYHGFSDVFKDGLSLDMNRGSYFAIHISLPFITDELAEKNIKD